VGFRQMRRTELSKMSMALAIVRPVQLSHRVGGAVHVKATTRGLRRDGREERIMKGAAVSAEGEPA